MRDYQVVCGLPHENATVTAKDHLETGLKQIVDQMNTYQDEITFYKYIPEDYELTTPPEDYDKEREWLRACADEMNEENWGSNENIILQGGDTWIIADDRHGQGDQDWGGYGRTYGKPIELDSIKSFGGYIYIGRVLDINTTEHYLSSPDPDEVFEAFVIHETAHMFGAEHHNGDYSLGRNIYDTKDVMENVTPMATSYVRSSSGGDGSSDTCGWGTYNIPDLFATKQNYAYYDYCGYCWNTCRHVLQMTDTGYYHHPTMKIIKENAPL